MLAVFSSLLIACAPPPPRADSDGDTGPSSTGGPELEITFPVTLSDALYCPRFVVTVHVENFKLLAADDPQEPDAGHWHLLFNKADSALWNYGKPFYTIPVDEPLAPGINRLEAWLADQAHEPITERDIVEIEVADPKDKQEMESCLGDPS